MSKSEARPGGHLLIEQLAANGCDTVFCVPGESFLAALDGLYDNPGIRTIICRQEGGAAMMAEATGKLTGRPAVCFVTRGPGATNAASGVHVAMQDGTPMILLIGQIDRGARDRMAFQEVDYRQMYAPLAKWSAQIENAERIPEYLNRAFHTAVSGRPGPVVVALPEDMLAGPVQTPVVPAPRPVAQAADDGAVREALALLGEAERPLIVAGGGSWSAACRASLEDIASRTGIPVVTEFRCQDFIDNLHPSFVGATGVGSRPETAAAIRESDLLMLVGGRMGEMDSDGYTHLDIPVPRQTLIHVQPDIDELNRVYRPDLGVHAAPEQFLAALAGLDLPARDAWRERGEALHHNYLESLEPAPQPGDLQLAEVVRQMNDRLGDDAVITNGAGTNTAWLHRYFSFRGYPRQLAPRSGSMGYGLPAAIAAALTDQDRRAVCFTGDGCLMMTVQELATAAKYRLPVIVIVVNNGIYGTIRMHQARDYPGRVVGTDLHNPDFVALSRSFGGDGRRVDNTAGFADALEAALQSDRPFVIELAVDPDGLVPGRRLSEIEAR